jgi:hypothetical protein
MTREKARERSTVDHDIITVISWSSGLSLSEGQRRLIQVFYNTTAITSHHLAPQRRPWLKNSRPNEPDINLPFTSSAPLYRIRTTTSILRTYRRARYPQFSAGLEANKRQPLKATCTERSTVNRPKQRRTAHHLLC